MPTTISVTRPPDVENVVVRLPLPSAPPDGLPLSFGYALRTWLNVERIPTFLRAFSFINGPVKTGLPVEVVPTLRAIAATLPFLKMSVALDPPLAARHLHSYPVNGFGQASLPPHLAIAVSAAIPSFTPPADVPGVIMRLGNDGRSADAAAGGTSTPATTRVRTRRCTAGTLRARGARRQLTRRPVQPVRNGRIGWVVPSATVTSA